MVLLPARCRNCGHQWQPAGGIDVRGASGLDIQDSTGGPCPKCGGVGEFVSGQLNVVDGAIEMLSGPQWSWDLVAELGLALQRAIDQGTDPAAALAEVDVRAARSFHAATVGKPPLFKRAVAGALVLLFADFAVARGNVDAAIRAASELLRYVADHGHLPGS